MAIGVVRYARGITLRSHAFSNPKLARPRKSAMPSLTISGNLVSGGSKRRGSQS